RPARDRCPPTRRGRRRPRGPRSTAGGRPAPPGSRRRRAPRGRTLPERSWCIGNGTIARCRRGWGSSLPEGQEPLGIVIEEHCPLAMGALDRVGNRDGPAQHHLTLLFPATGGAEVRGEHGANLGAGAEIGKHVELV